MGMVHSVGRDPRAGIGAAASAMVQIVCGLARRLLGAQTAAAVGGSGRRLRRPCANLIEGTIDGFEDYNAPPGAARRLPAAARPAATRAASRPARGCELQRQPPALARARTPGHLLLQTIRSARPVQTRPFTRSTTAIAGSRRGERVVLGAPRRPSSAHGRRRRRHGGHRLGRRRRRRAPRRALPRGRLPPRRAAVRASYLPRVQTSSSRSMRPAEISNTPDFESDLRTTCHRVT